MRVAALGFAFSTAHFALAGAYGLILSAGKRKRTFGRLKLGFGHMPSSKVAVCNAQRQTVPMGCSTPAHLMLQSSASAEVPTGPGSRIKSGDEVIVYLAHGEMQSAVVDTARIFDCRFGAFPMKVKSGYIVVFKKRSNLILLAN